jgi:hypothetical protein
MEVDSSKVKLYSIDKIVNKKKDENGLTQYEIKWSGVEKINNSWQRLEILIEDKAFDSIFEFEKTDYAKSLPMNEDTENFLKIFEEYLSKNIKINEYGDYPLDEAEKILNIIMDYNSNERYALIQWKKRIYNNIEIQPLNSWVNCKVLSVFDGELFCNFMKELIEKNHNEFLRKKNKKIN